MTVKKKSNPFTNGRSSEAALSKQRSKPIGTPRGPESSQSQGLAHTGVTSSGSGPSQIALEQRMYCNDPAQVQQWAANSATGFNPFEDLSGQEHYSASYGSAPMMARTDSQLPRSFPMSRSSVSPVSLQQPTQDFGAAPGIDYNNFYTCSTGAATGLEAGLNIQQAPSYGSIVDFAPSQYNHDAWSYPTPTPDDMLYANYAAIPNTTMEGQSHNTCFQPTWPQMSCPSGDESLNTGINYAPNPMSGSPLSAVDPSVSSSYSQNSFVGPEPDTPISQAIQEGTWSPDRDNGCFQGFNIGESMQFSSPVDYADHNGDGPRLVLLSDRFPRHALTSHQHPESWSAISPYTSLQHVGPRRGHQSGVHGS